MTAERDRESPKPATQVVPAVAEPGKPPADAEAEIVARLRAKAWAQGHLLSAAKGHFELGLPRNPNGLELRWWHEEAAPTDRLVIATQACDIIKRPSRDPNVEALFAFETADRALIHNADRNSARYFLLNPERGLIADVGRRVQVQKTVLLSRDPEPGLVDDPQRRARFAQWLGRRYSRPAIPDSVVTAVVEPIGRLVKDMRDARNVDLGAIMWINEIRFRRLQGPPFDVELLLVADRPVPGDEQIAIARFVGNIAKRLEAKGARLVSWEMASLAQVSYEGILQTDEVVLDDVTFEGEALH